MIEHGRDHSLDLDVGDTAMTGPRLEHVVFDPAQSLLGRLPVCCMQSALQLRSSQRPESGDGLRWTESQIESGHTGPLILLRATGRCPGTLGSRL